MKSKAFSKMFAGDFLQHSDPLAFVTQIVDTMYDAVVVHCEGTVVFVNSGAVNLLGVESPQQLLGHSVLEFVHPGDHDKAKARMHELMLCKDARLGTMPYRLLRGDGKEIYAEVQASRLDGTPSQSLLVIHDITAQHQYQKELDRLQMLIDQAVDAIYATDTEGRFLFVNQTCEQLLKLARSELIGRSFVPFIAAEQLATVQKTMQKKLAGTATSSTYELDIIDCEGGRHPMENSSSLVTDDDGKPIAVQGVLRDLSRRRESQEQIHMFTQTMEHVEESIFITDLDGVVCYANRDACDMFQLDIKQIIGKTIADLRSCDEAQLQEIRALLEDGKTWRKVLEVPSLDGVSRWISCMICPIPDDEGRTQYHACIDRNITEQQRQQSQLEHVQRLESLGVLAGGIAHDFNNILTAIVGNTALAETKLQRNPLQVRKHLARIQQSTERAALLCRQMLAYSGKGKFVIKQVDLSREVREMSSLLEVSLHKQVSFRLELADDLQLLEADESQLQQLMMNLITNANESIDGAGNIVLRTGMIKPTTAWLQHCVGVEQAVPSQNFVFMQVEDDGCGMDAETCAKIFDPFFTTKFTGRGLGMSALLGIVRGHHGYIHIDSSLGHGSTFTVLFPPVKVVREEAVAAVAEPDAHYHAARAATVLVVDDESSVCEATVAMLEDDGYTTLSAEDGEAGVACYCQHADEIDLVMLDLTMPKMGGKEALAQLHQLKPTLPVLIVSGFTEDDIKARFVGGQVSGFLFKPYSQQQLRDAVANALLADA
ncbi:MAG: PAS domain S-box protein [Mariprofundales bacterium]